MINPLDPTPIPSNIVGCGPSRFDYQSAPVQSDVYISHAVYGNCPSGETGPVPAENGYAFTVPGGKFTSTISQADADAQATAHLQALIAQDCQTLPAPVITSGTLAAHGNSTFNFAIAATNSPTSYAATSASSALRVITSDQASIISAQGGSLANTLVIDTETGVIIGSVGNYDTQINSNPAPGNYNINISATNGAGTATGTLTITVLGYLTLTTTPATISNSGSAQPTGLILEVSLDGGTAFLAEPGSTYAAYKSIQVSAAGNVSLERTSSGASTAALQQAFTITPTGTVAINTATSENTENMTFPSLVSGSTTGTPQVTSECTAGTHVFDLSSSGPLSPAEANANASANPFAGGSAYSHLFSVGIVNTKINVAYECTYSFQTTFNF